MTRTTFPRIVLATLNARYIHASLGLRYLLANLDRHGAAGLRACTELREYTISRPAPEVVADLLATLGSAPSAETPGGVQVVGFGVYIWNVTQTTEVIRLLKAARPDLKIVLGGPEVSHETDQQAITHLADHVITGWGDVSFAKLCRALLDGPQPLMKIIPGEQPPLADIELPYGEYSDADLAHRLLYVEGSRGCPFKCEFCLSALDKTAWGFELDRVLAALDVLYQRGARTFKFVDRTFNLKIEHSVRVLQFFLDVIASEPTRAPEPHSDLAPDPVTASHPYPARYRTRTLNRDFVTASVARQSMHPESHGLPRCARNDSQNLFLHFEVIPDHLPDRLRAMLAQFPPGVLQLEVGVQTFNLAVQQTISRRQDNDATEANLRWLLAHTHAHLHIDLIFGLPGETLQSFADGFDRLLAIGPHELQLGILKRLRGAPIARHSASHGMVYATEPPYTVQRTGVVDAATLQRFGRLARYWELLANSGRFARTLPLLLHPPPIDGSVGATPFWCFMAFSDWMWQRQGSTHRLTPEALVDALFDYLSASQSPVLVRQALLADYLASGARANPKALQGLLPRRTASPAKAGRTLATRQERHRVPTPLPLPS